MTPDRDRGRPRVGRSAKREQGSATAEMAVGLPVVIFLLLVGLTGVTAVRDQLRCVDAAREAARAAARGESGDVAGRRAAPDGATVSVRVDAETARAVVRVRVHPLGRRMPAFVVQGYAVAALEPGESP